MDAVASPFSTVLSLAMAAGAVAFGFLILKIVWGQGLRGGAPLGGARALGALGSSERRHAMCAGNIVEDTWRVRGDDLQQQQSTTRCKAR